MSYKISPVSILKKKENHLALRSTVSNPDSGIIFGDDNSGGVSLDSDALLCLGGGTGAGGAAFDFRRLLILIPPL